MRLIPIRCANRHKVEHNRLCSGPLIVSPARQHWTKDR
jgi:hypothetical protein